MADTNNERVGKALDLLKEGLAPFAAREVKAALSDKQLNAADLQRFTSDPMLSKRPVVEWDAAALLALMWETWNQVFRQTLGPAERGLVGSCGGTAPGGPIRSPSPPRTPTGPSIRPTGF